LIPSQERLSEIVIFTAKEIIDVYTRYISPSR